MGMIYLDNNATTSLSVGVKKAIIEHLSEYGNPSSPYELGSNIKNEIEAVREIIANSINAKPEEIYFTSGGSEGNTFILNGVSNHIVTSNIEHSSIKNFKKRADYFAEVPVMSDGLLNIKELNKILKIYEDTRYKPIVSIQFANSEIGVVQDIKTIAKLCHNYGVLFHTDAVQAYPYINIDVKQLGIDMMTVSGHKFHAPKGVGFVYIRNGINIKPLISGGSQEKGLRGGTENTLGIFGMGAAVTELDYNQELYDRLSSRFLCNLSDIKGIKINGSYEHRLFNNLSITIPGISSASLVQYLDMNDICISSGSACDTGHISHVLKAIGLTDEEAESTIRIGFNSNIKEIDVDIVTEKIKEFIALTKEN